MSASTYHPTDSPPGPTGTPPRAASHPGRSRFLPTIHTRMIALLGVLLALCIVGVVTRPDAFLTEGNISTMLRLAAAIGVVSVGMTFVITGGGIDPRSARSSRWPASG